MNTPTTPRAREFGASVSTDGHGAEWNRCKRAGGAFEC